MELPHRAVCLVFCQDDRARSPVYRTRLNYAVPVAAPRPAAAERRRRVEKSLACTALRRGIHGMILVRMGVAIVRIAWANGQGPSGDSGVTTRCRRIARGAPFTTRRGGMDEVGQCRARSLESPHRPKERLTGMRHTRTGGRGRRRWANLTLCDRGDLGDTMLFRYFPRGPAWRPRWVRIPWWSRREYTRPRIRGLCFADDRPVQAVAPGCLPTRPPSGCNPPHRHAGDAMMVPSTRRHCTTRRGAT